MIATVNPCSIKIGRDREASHKGIRARHIGHALVFPGKNNVEQVTDSLDVNLFHSLVIRVKLVKLPTSISTKAFLPYCCCNEACCAAYSSMSDGMIVACGVPKQAHRYIACIRYRTTIITLANRVNAPAAAAPIRTPFAWDCLLGSLLRRRTALVMPRMTAMTRRHMTKAKANMMTVASAMEK